MRQVLKRNASLLLAAAIAALSLVACQPTGTPRCDGILQPQADVAHDMGWRLRCDPPANYTPPAGVTGYAEQKTMTAWLWADRMPDDRILSMIAWHEDGHVWEFLTGRYVNDEARASQWGWCFASMAGDLPEGVGMPGWGPPPEGCGIFA